MGALVDQVVAGYEAAAEALIPRYDALIPEEVLRPVLDLIPPHPVAVLDIGAGPGGTAIWLAEKGHHVTATEPCAPFRSAFRRRAPDIPCLPDRLPHLPGVKGPFDLIVISGVWHHLDAPDRTGAWRRLSELLAQTGLILMSLRHGPAPSDRPAAPCDPTAETALAEVAGLEVTRRVDTGSIQPRNQAAGVTWTWLALKKAPTP